MLGLLREQVDITISALDAVVAWAQGEPAAIDVIHGAEERGDEAKRALFAALRAAFVTPLEPEDVFALSRGIGWILNYARDITTESRVMECPPDEVVADMVRLLAESMRAIDRALEALGTSDETARPRRPTRRSRRNDCLSVGTTRAWGPCSITTDGRSASPGVSSTVGARGSASS